MDTIKVVDQFTADTWLRKVGDGPWYKVDMGPYGGRPPVVVFHGDYYTTLETELTKEEAGLRGLLGPAT